MPKTPPRQVCPLCATDDGVDVVSTGPDLWEFSCSNDQPSHPYSWPVNTGVPITVGRTGVGEELGVYDDLLRCVHTDEFVEYGIVEYRFAQEAPASYRALVDQYGHVNVRPTKYTASSFLSHALGQLSREGLFVYTEVKATGYWDYLSKVSAWRRSETSPDTPLTTWADFATSIGAAPDVWAATST
ncbi:MAG: hypothetical protein AB7N61_12315 [Acidimicrobiia bacterium]